MSKYRNLLQYVSSETDVPPGHKGALEFIGTVMEELWDSGRLEDVFNNHSPSEVCALIARALRLHTFQGARGSITVTEEHRIRSFLYGSAIPGHVYRSLNADQLRAEYAVQYLYDYWPYIYDYVYIFGYSDKR